MEKSTPNEVLTVRQLNVVDEAGTKRLILGAPLPGPMMGGKPQSRRSAASGLSINDSNGNEVGGIGMLDDGTQVLCFDQNGRERACLYVLPTGRAGLMLQDPKGRQRIGVTVDADSTSALQFLDEQEKPYLTIPDAKARP